MRYQTEILINQLPDLSALVSHEVLELDSFIHNYKSLYVGFRAYSLRLLLRHLLLQNTNKYYGFGLSMPIQPYEPQFQRSNACG